MTQSSTIIETEFYRSTISLVTKLVRRLVSAQKTFRNPFVSFMKFTKFCYTNGSLLGSTRTHQLRRLTMMNRFRSSSFHRCTCLRMMETMNMLLKSYLQIQPLLSVVNQCLLKTTTIRQTSSFQSTIQSAVHTAA